jgi:hypothetical protein
MFSSRDMNFEWNGKIGSTDSYAPDGVYFFAVSAEGPDKKGKTITQKIKGNVHLFGNK